MSDLRLDLEQKIHRYIPISTAMQFAIDELSEHAILVRAPLAPNVNIHGTGFAGSIYSLAVLTGWALATHIMQCEGMQGELVVGRAEIKYRAPIASEIECSCSVGVEDAQAFRDDFIATGKGRLKLVVTVGDAPAALLQGTYVAVAAH